MTVIYSLPLFVLFLLILLPCTLLGFLGVWLVRGNNWMLDPADKATISLAHAFASVLYAVALGLMVVNVQSDYSEVEMVVMKEASLAADLYIDSEGLSGSAGNEIQQLAMDYVDSVIDEWDTLSKDTVLTLPSHKAADQLTHHIIKLEPQGDKQLVIYAELLGGVNEMLDLRRERLHLGLEGVGAVTWIVVAMGAVITIGMAWFHHTKSARAHYFVVGTMSLMFGLMCFLIMAMDHPLLGRFSVDSSPFVEARDDIAVWNSEFHE